MENEYEKEICRHANLPNHHPNSPLRAVRRNEIRAATHIADSSFGTSTPLPPALVPAAAAASRRPTTTTAHYVPVQFKKPANPPKKGLVKAKEKFPLQRSIEKSINAMMISKDDHDCEKADQLDGVFRKDFDKIPRVQICHMFFSFMVNLEVRQYVCFVITGLANICRPLAMPLR